MNFKWILLIAIAGIGIFCVFIQYKSKGIKMCVVILVGIIATGMLASYLFNIVNSHLPYFGESNSTKGVSNDGKQLDIKDGSILQENRTNATSNASNLTFNDQETENITKYMLDITGKTSIGGIFDEERQDESYKFVAEVAGTYHFEPDTKTTGNIQLEIKGLDEKIISSDTNNLTVELEKNKTYILKIKSKDGACVYGINIGIPANTLDITGKKELSGNITYKNQNDKYKYTAPVSGTYYFNTDLSAGSSVWIEIDGENGNYIKSEKNGLTIDLETGKTYILIIKYCQGVCDYTISIGVPSDITDITGMTMLSGNITYQNQNDRYLYTTSTTGTYRFDTDLSAGSSVWIEIDGENGNYIKSEKNGLTIDLEAGKTYILSVEYCQGVCDYTISIGVPIDITDITGMTMIAGNITYQNQNDRYLYTASTTGTYRFDTDLSAGSSVWIEIDGENGNYIKSEKNGLTIDLEAGKTYILSIEYCQGVCDYTISIGVPIDIIDITGMNAISGKLTYKDQKDRYKYIAPVDGIYQFNTNLSSGGKVFVRISGENGSYINAEYNKLKLKLEAGKTYILSIEYANEVCTYEVGIEID